MAEEQVADLFAALGLKVDVAQWSKGGQAIAGVDSRLAKLEAHWVDGQGKAVASLKYQTAGAGALGRAVGDAGAKAKSAGDQVAGLWHLAAGYAAYAGIEHASHALIGFNADVQDAKISLSAMISGMTGAEWGKAQGQATALYEEFQRFSTQTPVTTQRILEFGQGIAAATFAAGGGVKELQNLTEQGVIAAKVLGGNRGAGYAELEITEMLSGTINKRMILARQLLSFGHMTEEQFKALDGKGRIAALQKIFNSDAMNHARDAMGKSFTGVTSTMWDKMQIAFGKIGLPLFEAITQKVAELNKWMDKNKTTIERYAKSVGGSLVKAFEALVTAITFVSDHATFFEGVLIGLGAFITAFAVQAAVEWAIAFWPITLGIAAIAALHAAFEWLTDDTDEATESMEKFGNVNLKSLTTQLDAIRGGKVGPIGTGPTAGQEGAPALHGFYGDTLDEDTIAKYREGMADDGPQAAIGKPVAERPRSSMPASPNVTVRPQVNVQVSGNMPEGWIDTKIQTAIDDHHETTWNNAAHALQADDDE